jgi:hypothetical protein
MNVSEKDRILTRLATEDADAVQRELTQKLFKTPIMLAKRRRVGLLLDQMGINLDYE